LLALSQPRLATHPLPNPPTSPLPMLAAQSGTRSPAPTDPRPPIPITSSNRATEFITTTPKGTSQLATGQPSSRDTLDPTSLNSSTTMLGAKTEWCLRLTRQTGGHHTSSTVPLSSPTRQLTSTNTTTPSVRTSLLLILGLLSTPKSNLHKFQVMLFRSEAYLILLLTPLLLQFHSLLERLDLFGVTKMQTTLPWLMSLLRMNVEVPFRIRNSTLCVQLTSTAICSLIKILLEAELMFYQLMISQLLVPTTYGRRTTYTRTSLAKTRSSAEVLLCSKEQMIRFLTTLRSISMLLKLPAA